jgi:hypothetical protein
MPKTEFHPVIELPENYEVFQFDRKEKPNQLSRQIYGVGRYAEKRPGLYKGELYSTGRDFHLGIDLAAPPGSPVYAFDDGEILSFQNHLRPFDYGPTLVTKHRFKGENLYVLLGHLSLESLSGLKTGEPIEKGQAIGWVGNKKENGGWEPHIHVQCSWQAPKEADMPGVILEKDFEKAKRIYPDPRIILGPLY